MHGPTFMANPLACAVANASIDLLIETDWAGRVGDIERRMREILSPCGDMPQVADVRFLGAIAVVEMKQAVDMASITASFVDAGIWVRPFGRLVYLMPAYVIGEQELTRLCNQLRAVVAQLPG